MTTKNCLNRIRKKIFQELSSKRFLISVFIFEKHCAQGRRSVFCIGGAGGGGDGNNQALEMVTCRGSGGILCQKILKS